MPRKTASGPLLAETATEPNLEEPTRIPVTSHAREASGNGKVSATHRKKWTKTIAALCVMLVVVPIIAGYGSYSFGFKTGSDSGYNQGHEVGYQIGFSYGNQSGYLNGNSSGFEQGYTSGNVSGYGDGYQVGYSYGNSSGYQAGYTLGNSSGYTNGFGNGYSEGNSSGYQNGYQNGYAGGNQSGYELGFISGNSSGYQSGYASGLSSGSQSGYSQGYTNGNAAGYQTGYLQGVKDGAGRGYNIRDPTYQEMLNFIATDQTDKNPYVPGSYVCWNFAADVINNAFKIGYKCGFVYIYFTDGYGHAVICFNTTDHGLVFIEPQNDAIVQIYVGVYYTFTGETIVQYGVIW